MKPVPKILTRRGVKRLVEACGDVLARIARFIYSERNPS